MELVPNPGAGSPLAGGPRCGSIYTKEKKPCRNPAGMGTKHPGEGLCTHHGGNDVPEGARKLVPLLAERTQLLTVEDLTHLVDAGTAALIVARASLVERLLMGAQLSTREVSDLTSSIQRLDKVLKEHEMPEMAAPKDGGGDPLDDELKRLIALEGGA